LPGEPVGPPERWTVTSNVEVGQTTYPVSNGRVEREGREGSEKNGREGGNATGAEDQPKDPYPKRVGSIEIFVHSLPEFQVASLPT